MATKRVNFVTPKDRYGNIVLRKDCANQNGFCLEGMDIEDAEQILRNNYGFMDCEAGFAQELIDWYFQEEEDTLLRRAKRIVNFVCEMEWNDTIDLTIEEWVILEHTAWLIKAGQRDNKRVRELEGRIRELERK